MIPWINFVAIAAAAFLLSFRANITHIRIAYVLFVVAGISWTIIFFQREDWASFCQWMILNVANGIGVYRWWRHQ